ncbi:MAG: hypothetical protein MZV65_37910 [Chromatiales bacterium]|nr:hypothetical protein [Chromatiales bacterium]
MQRAMELPENSIKTPGRSHAELPPFPRAGWHVFLHRQPLQRRPNDLLVRQGRRDLLRSVVRDVRRRWPFHIDGWGGVAGSLALHLISLAGDIDFTTAGGWTKAGFARQLSVTEGRSPVRGSAVSAASGSGASGSMGGP